MISTDSFIKTAKKKHYINIIRKINNMYQCITETEDHHKISALGVSEKQAVYFAWVASKKFGAYEYPGYTADTAIHGRNNSMITTTVEASDLNCGAKCDNCGSMLQNKIRTIKDKRNGEGELQYSDCECIVCGAPIKVFND
jgi:hypothetical protein